MTTPTREELLTIDQLKQEWDSQADKFNQWDELGLDEIVHFAQERFAALLSAHQAQSAGFPARIHDLLKEVASRVPPEGRGVWEDEKGEPMQDDADAALAWIAAHQAQGEPKFADFCNGDAVIYPRSTGLASHFVDAPPSSAQTDQAWNEPEPIIPDVFFKIGELLRTQDNRYTDQPLFIVQQKRVITGIDTAYTDQIAWVDSDSQLTSGEEFDKLEAAYQETCDEPDGWTRTGYHEEWEFVTACFTEQGCKDYLSINSHNLKEPRIYADGSYRNAEYRLIRDWLRSLKRPLQAQEPGAEVCQNQPETRMAAEDNVVEREAFEAFAKDNFFCLAKTDADGGYTSWPTQMAWNIWQETRRAAVELSRAQTAPAVDLASVSDEELHMDACEFSRPSAPAPVSLSSSGVSEHASPVYGWLERASRSGLSEVEHSARTMMAYYQGAEFPEQPVAEQVVAWMRDNHKECITAESKRQMESADFGSWKEVAKRYTIPLSFAAHPQAAQAKESGNE